MINKHILVVLLCISIFTYSRAQDIRIHGYASYVFDDKFATIVAPTDFVEGTIEGGLQWGVGLEFRGLFNKGINSFSNTGIELMYFRQDTDLPVTYFGMGGTQSLDLDMNSNHVLLGGIQYFRISDVSSAYLGAMGGTVIYGFKNASGLQLEDDVKIGWGAKLGGHIWISDHVGIKAQAQVLSTVEGFIGGVYLGSAPLVSASTASTVYQFSLGGGLVFQLGKE